ncbi:36 kDa membrane antigen [Providencia rustigianii]|uniref:36 kDa membrane antigen n=1 Tax=Providencia rustigianii TaxID=158850 RepID=A0A379FZ70_9GAMM|nr:36 kDa membrane antigen [Providencia rustigianii]
MMMDTFSLTSYAHSLLLKGGKPVESQTQVNTSVRDAGLSPLDAQGDVYQQATQHFQQLGYDVALEPYQERAVSSDIERLNDQIKDVKRRSKRAVDRYNQASRHIADAVVDGRPHVQGISNLIENIHSGYQKKYGEVVKASTQYMQDVNTAVGKMSQYITAGSDGKIQLKPEALLQDMDKMISKYSGKSYSGSDPGAYFGGWSADFSNATPLTAIKGTQEEFEFWDKKLSGQGFIVEYKNNEIKIYPDMKPIAEMYYSVTHSSATWNGSDIMSQELQSLQTAIDAQKNAVNSSVSRLLETFRQDNSHFETLVQLLIQLIKDLNQNNNSLINM